MFYDIFVATVSWGAVFALCPRAGMSKLSSSVIFLPTASHHEWGSSGSLSLLPFSVWALYCLLCCRCSVSPRFFFRAIALYVGVYSVCLWEKVSSYTAILDLPFLKYFLKYQTYYTFQDKFNKMHALMII